MTQPQLHLYTGPGKGKTTAAFGAALRAAGHGERVIIAQFLKDGTSGEVTAARAVPGITIWPVPPVQGFTFQMTETQLAATAAQQTAAAAALGEAVQKDPPFLLVLDELCAAITTGLVPQDTAQALVSGALSVCEVIVTGRDAPAWLRDQAAYLTEMQAVRHPWEQGLNARPGIEW